MASLYKKPIFVKDPTTGKRIKTKSKKWWGRFRDERGLEKRVPLAADKTAAQAMLHQLVRKMERKAAGLVDPFEEHSKRPLKQHLTDFIASLKNKGSNADYVKTTEQRCGAILRACKFDRMDQISASRVQAFLSELRDTGRSVASSNHYLRAIKMFTRWLVRDRRTNDDRLAHLSKMNVDVECERQDLNLHPLRDWILSPRTDLRKPQTPQEIRESKKTEVPPVVPTSLEHANKVPQGDFSDPEAVEFLAAWAKIPPAIRAGIVSIVQASGKTQER